MYFTKIRLNGLEVIDLPIVHARPSDLYILKNADGLGPPEVEVSILDTINAGGFYQGRRVHSRELVFLVGLNPTYENNQRVSDLRESLYGLLTPDLAESVKIEIMDEETSLAYTTGYVKKFEVVPFSKTPEVQITMACLQQYWVTPSNLYVELTDKLHPFIENVGTAPAGFHMEVIFSSSVSGWTLMDDFNKKMLFNYTFGAGDILIIDTRPGMRGIWVNKLGVITNIIYTLSADSSWLILHGGKNQFHTNVQLFDWGDVYYLPQFWGI